MAKFDGGSIYNAHGSLIGKLDNESLYDSHGAGIGRIEGASGLNDPHGVSGVTAVGMVPEQEGPARDRISPGLTVEKSTVPAP